LDAQTPMGKANANIVMESKSLDLTGEANLSLNGSFDLNIGQALS
jgi:hypothetical protein